MRTALILTIISFAFLFRTKANAQIPTGNSTEKAVLELYLLDEYAVEEDGKPLPTHVLEVANESKEFEEIVGGGFAIVECTNCPLSAEFGFFIWKVEKLSNNETKIFFKVDFKHKSKCNTDSSIIVKKDKINTFNLKCRPKAKIIARFKSLKTTND